MRKKVTHYSNIMWIYGLYSLLIALDYFESVENYDECNYIKKGIEHNEKITGVELYKRLNESDFENLTRTQRVIQKQNAIKLIEDSKELL